MAKNEEFIPKWIAWESTQRCNLNCVHCRCSSDLEAAQGDIDTAGGKKLIDDIAELSTPVSTTHFTEAHHGSIYGLATEPTRFLHGGLEPKTPIRTYIGSTASS